MFKIYFIGFSLSLVAANPIVQRIPIPSPACPPPTCSTCPAQTCPNTSRPAPCQACQNPYRSIYSAPALLVRQPTNNCPCNNPVTVQNAVANPPINTESLTQLLLRMLLNPIPQIPTSPNIKTHNERELEAHKPAPNVINNYIIMPPDFFKGNATKMKDEDREQRTRPVKRRRKGRQRNKETVPCSCDDKDEQHHDDENVDSKQEIPCPCSKDNTTKSIAPLETQDVDIKNTSQVNRVEDKIVPIDTVSNNIEMNQNDKNIQNDEELSQKTADTEPQSVDIDKPKRRHRIRTKNIEEAIIRDFCSRYPTIPEEIARSLLNNLKKQINLPYSPYSYYPPIVNPEDENSEKVQNRARNNNQGSRRRKPHRSGRRYKKPKEETKELSEDHDEKCDKAVAVNPAIINIETETITTEKITASTDKFNEKLSIKDSESQVETPDNLIDQLEQIKEKFVKLNEIETTTVNYNKHIEPFPELGKEDKVPTVYNNAVDEYDYYPDFRNDNVHLFASDEECDIKQEKFHYTTDRNGESDCKRYVSKKEPTLDTQNVENNNSFKDGNGSECSVSIPPDCDDSNEESIGDNSGEIHFRPPPHLELPDFETKQINRYKDISEKIVTDDFDTVSYSDAVGEPRIPEIEMKPAKVFTKDKTGRTNIETVYGHSKVVRYGHDGQGAESNPVITYYLPEEAMTEERIQLPDDEAAVVVAKSIHDLIDSW